MSKLEDLTGWDDDLRKWPPKRAFNLGVVTGCVGTLIGFWLISVL